MRKRSWRKHRTQARVRLRIPIGPSLSDQHRWRMIVSWNHYSERWLSLSLSFGLTNQDDGPECTAESRVQSGILTIHILTCHRPTDDLLFIWEKRKTRRMSLISVFQKRERLRRVLFSPSRLSCDWQKRQVIVYDRHNGISKMVHASHVQLLPWQTNG